MKQTTNYQLNQWETQDRILREDFNADNFKIEQALKVLQAEIEAARAAVPIVKLLDYTVPTDTSEVVLDVSGIDWSQYAAVTLYSNARAALTSGTSNPYILFDVDGCTYANGQEHALAFSANSSAAIPGFLRIDMEGLCPTDTLSAFLLTGKSAHFNNHVTNTSCLCYLAAETAVTALHFQATVLSSNGATTYNDKIKADSRFWLYGLKK